MQCELCKKNEASVHFKQVVDGEARELMVCAECAAKNGFEVQSPLDLTDFLFGVGVQSTGNAVPTDRTCSHCGMTLSEYRRLSRLGCDACYEVFRPEIDEVLRSSQAGMQHVGRAPGHAVVMTRMAELRRQLDQAVARQDFEEAAVIRDQVHALEVQSPDAGRTGHER